MSARLQPRSLRWPQALRRTVHLRGCDRAGGECPAIPTLPISTAPRLIQAIAGNGAWVAIHLAIIVAILLIIGGLVGLAEQMEGTSVEPLARLGLAAALLGGAIVTVSSAIDGFVMKALAVASPIAAAPDAALALGSQSRSRRSTSASGASAYSRSSGLHSRASGARSPAASDSPVGSAGSPSLAPAGRRSPPSSRSPPAERSRLPRRCSSLRRCC